MNKAELIGALESKLGSKKAASDALEAVLDVIIREVARGGKVGITGFGTFQKVARGARTGRNPRTGETVKIKKTTVPKFNAGTAFKKVVADPRQLPKAAAAGGRASAGAATKAASAAAGATKSAAKRATSATKAAASKTAKAAPAKSTAKAAPAKKATTTRAAATKTAKADAGQEGDDHQGRRHEDGQGRAGQEDGHQGRRDQEHCRRKDHDRPEDRDEGDAGQDDDAQGGGQEGLTRITSPVEGCPDATRVRASLYPRAGRRAQRMGCPSPMPTIHSRVTDSPSISTLTR